MSSVSLAERLRVMGVEAPRECAARIVGWIQRWGEPPQAWIEALLEDLVGSPDSAMTLVNWERWFEQQGSNPWPACPGPEQTETLSLLFGQSQFLTDILLGNPSLAERLFTGDALERAVAREAMDGELQTLLANCAAGECRQMLCDWRRWQMLRIGMRDLLNRADVETLTREISDVAEAVIQAALDVVWGEMARRHGPPRDYDGNDVGFAILGMGKLGGRELNFSSDVDLIFIYSAEGESEGREGGREGRVENARFMRRLSERLIDFVASVGPEGRLYRVDMRLRPEGNVGPIARSLESLEVYFGSQARLWERLAYTKARVVARRGPESLAEALERMIRRFCYGTLPGPELPRELATLKHRIDREVARSAGAEGEVKRGAGGIREIEFVVGLFQLINGHSQEDLRTVGLLETLRGLQRHHLFTEAAALRLRRAYETLRRVEHRLQMMNEFQTHMLPSDPVELDRLARRLGWTGHEARRRFMADLQQITAMVHQAFLQHIGAPELTDVAEDVAAVLSDRTPVEQAAEILARFGFADPTSAVALMRGLGRGGTEAYVNATAQSAFERLLPALLAWCPQVPSADLALRQMTHFVDAYKARGVLYTLMAEQPQLVEVLMRLFGASEFLGALLARHPEFFESVVAQGLGLQLPDEVLGEMWEQLAPRRMDDARRVLDALRTLRQMSLLSITLRQILGLDGWVRMASHMSNLAEFILRRAWDAIVDRDEEPLPATCIALGKFGGREINVLSDLDVVFVCRPPQDMDEPDQMEWMVEVTRRAERLITAAAELTRRGTLFEIDARLRPEGRNAPLVCTEERLAAYFASGAQLWEFQTFLRARPVAGDMALGERVIGSVHAAMRERLGAMDLRGEIQSMRQRLEENADHPGGTGSVDLKRDPGGIIDIEFLVQLAQLEALRDTGARPEVNTAQAILSLPARPNFDPIEGAMLRRHLLTMRVIECQLRLLRGTPGSVIPADASLWTQLAIAHLGPRSDADEMREHVHEVMAPVREMFTRALAE